MAKIISVPLFPDYHYEYSIALEGVSYIIEFMYVDKLKLYTMSLYTSRKRPIVTGVGVVPRHKILGSYAIPGLSGYFMLVTKAEAGQESYKEHPEKLSEYYRMAYVY